MHEHKMYLIDVVKEVKLDDKTFLLVTRKKQFSPLVHSQSNLKLANHHQL
jgi:hypothetical protein